MNVCAHTHFTTFTVASITFYNQNMASLKVTHELVARVVQLSFWHDTRRSTFNWLWLEKIFLTNFYKLQVSIMYVLEVHDWASAKFHVFTGAQLSLICNSAFTELY